MRCHLSVSHLDLVNVLTRQFPNVLKAVAQARWAEKRNAGRDPLGEEEVRQQPQCLGGSESLADRLYQPLGYPGPQLLGEAWGWHGLLSTNNGMSRGTAEALKITPKSPGGCNGALGSSARVCWEMPCRSAGRAQLCCEGSCGYFPGDLAFRGPPAGSGTCLVTPGPGDSGDTPAGHSSYAGCSGLQGVGQCGTQSGSPREPLGTVQEP